MDLHLLERWRVLVKKMAGKGYLKLGYVHALSYNEMNNRLK